MFDKEEEWVEQAQNTYNNLDANSEFVTIEGVPVVRKIRFLQETDTVNIKYENLRQIALIRHGEPDLLKVGRFSYDDAKNYIKSYDSVEIIKPDRPFFDLEQNEDVAFFSSTINRAHSTARYLFGTDKPITANEDFREFERKIGDRRLRMKLPLKYWTTSARILWMLGFDNEGIESFSDAKKRAKRGADLLQESANKHQKVILVAHGFLNRYIEKSLEKDGWRVIRDGGSNYFATTILAKYCSEPTKPKKTSIVQSTTKN